MPRPIRILLVEDSTAYARLVELHLEELGGIELRHVGTLAAALPALAETDGVLLDLSLPDEHGLGALDRIRAARPELPVVVLSGRDEPGLRAELLARGAAAFVPKGEEPTLLGPALAAALA